MNTEIKILNGKTYKYIEGKWFRQRVHSTDEVDPHDPDYGILWDLNNLRP